VSTIGRHTACSAKAGAQRATRYTPALTIVAECRYALTGVGATIAPGSHEWNGYCADLLAAPTSTRTRPALTAPPVGGSATISLRRNVSAAWPINTNPTNIASPPSPVTSSACSAAARARGFSCELPIRRYDVID